MNGLLWALQDYAGLEFDDGEAILLYNTQRWPDDAPPAGRSAPGSSVRPSHVVSSYSAFWIGSSYEDGKRPSLRRLLKAASWLLMQTKDLPGVLEYLFELLVDGIVLDGYDVARAADLLLIHWQSVEDDRELPQCLFEGTPPQSARELFEADPKVDPNAPPRRELPPRILETIVEFADRQIQGAREAMNYDEWLVRQVVLERVLRAAKAVLEQHAPPSPGLTALLDQYEEMYCDSGATHICASQGPEETITVVAGLLVKIFGYDERLDRLHAERAVIADAIADELLNFHPLPPQWQMASPSVAAALATVAFDGGLHSLYRFRTSAFTPSEVSASKRVAEALLEFGLTQDDERLAAVYDAMNQSRPSDLNGVAVKIAEPQKLKDRLLNLAAAEEISVLFESARALPPAERIDIFQKAAALYPYAPQLQLELAIAYDEQGEPAAALPYMRTTLLLDPTEPLYWRSLAVICVHLSLEAEALPALTIEAWLTSLRASSPTAAPQEIA